MDYPTHRGFTLIELLAVISVVAMLAALLLPGLKCAADHAQVVKCLSNLRQIGVALEMYKQDNDSRYPTEPGKDWNSFRLGGTDPDPVYRQRFDLETSTNRLLWQYTHSREVYRCPADRGMDVRPFYSPYKNIYEAIGTSYKYNEEPWPAISVMRRAPKGGGEGLAGKTESWLSQPSQYILFHEPPAAPWYYGGRFYFFWHFARGKNTVFGLQNVKDRFISPILFADGHAAKHDFTQAIRSSPDYPFERQAQWYWYEPAQGAP
jgi:prepilin-type N-terminal cleavage/methylation domain-containing protein/prepilin-type processing-associated H-X9-DG protein